MIAPPVELTSVLAPVRRMPQLLVAVVPPVPARVMLAGPFEVMLAAFSILMPRLLIPLPWPMPVSEILPVLEVMLVLAFETKMPWFPVDPLVLPVPFNVMVPEPVDWMRAVPSMLMPMLLVPAEVVVPVRITFPLTVLMVGVPTLIRMPELFPLPLALAAPMIVIGALRVDVTCPEEAISTPELLIELPCPVPLRRIAAVAEVIRDPASETKIPLLEFVPEGAPNPVIVSVPLPVDLTCPPEATRTP